MMASDAFQEMGNFFEKKKIIFKSNKIQSLNHFHVWVCESQDQIDSNG